jgi:hypothetical protein
VTGRYICFKSREVLSVFVPVLDSCALFGDAVRRSARVNRHLDCSSFQLFEPRLYRRIANVLHHQTSAGNVDMSPRCFPVQRSKSNIRKIKINARVHKS